MTAREDKTRNAKRIVWFCVAGIIATLGTFGFVAFELSTAERIEAQEKFDPCVSLSAAVANDNRDRIQPLTRECRSFLNGLGPLVTIKLSCAIIEKARYICPAPGAGTRQAMRRDGTPLGPALTGASAGQASQPPTPELPGGTGVGKDGTPGGTKSPSKSPESSPKADPVSAASDPQSVTTPSPAPESEQKGGEQDSGPVKTIIKGVGETVKEAACSLTGPLLKAC